MIRKDDIKNILSSVKSDYKGVTQKDIAFCVLCDVFADKGTAYQMIYGEVSADAEAFYSSAKIKKLLTFLQSFGIGAFNDSSLSKEQNKAELLALLSKIQVAVKKGDIETKDALKMEADIRVKLNDKFDMEESQGQRRIIVVPQKHDLICPHTNRECSQMPTKEACIKYYKIKEAAQ